MLHPSNEEEEEERIQRKEKRISLKNKGRREKKNKKLIIKIFSTFLLYYVMGHDRVHVSNTLKTGPHHQLSSNREQLN